MITIDFGNNKKLYKIKHMKQKFKIIGLLALISCALISIFLFWNRKIIIHSGETLIKNIEQKKVTILLEENAVLQGGIEAEEGQIELGKGAKILGSIQLEKGEIRTGDDVEISQSIHLKKGNIVLGENNLIHENLLLGEANLTIHPHSILEKNIHLNEGKLRLESNVQVKGNVIVENGKIEKHSTAKIEGEKPAVYITYDWPEALQYFDILPESHKNQVGYIMLTKGNNGLIREEEITNGSQYFEGIYDYADGKIITIDLSDQEVMEKFFKKAKTFFTSLPERRMTYFNIGATTEDFAHDKNFADIYLPARGSGTLILHEMGHVMDFKTDYSDFHDPKYPWTKEDAVSGYGATHPGEDFAEAYRMYSLNPKKFLQLIKENPERQEKWNYLKEWVF